jgi:sec-independent protein translocase protein TatA
MDIGAPELIIVLLIVLLLFGPERPGRTLGELGKGVRSFREGLSGKSEDKPASTAEVKPEPPAADVDKPQS